MSTTTNRPSGTTIVTLIAAGDYRGALDACKGHTGYLCVSSLFVALIDIVHGIPGYDKEHPEAVRLMAEAKARAAQLAESLAYQQAQPPVLGFC